MTEEFNPHGRMVAALEANLPERDTFVDEQVQHVYNLRAQMESALAATAVIPDIESAVRRAMGAADRYLQALWVATAETQVGSVTSATLELLQRGYQELVAAQAELGEVSLLHYEAFQRDMEARFPFPFEPPPLTLMNLRRLLIAALHGGDIQEFYTFLDEIESHWNAAQQQFLMQADTVEWVEGPREIVELFVVSYELGRQSLQQLRTQEVVEGWAGLAQAFRHLEQGYRVVHSLRDDADSYSFRDTDWLLASDED